MKTFEKIRALSVSLTVACTALVGSTAHGYEYCKTVWNEKRVFPNGSTGDLVDWLFHEVKMDAPAREHEKVQSIDLIRKATSTVSFSPAAFFVRGDRGFIVVPDTFMYPLCAFVVTEYLMLGGSNTDLYETGRAAAARCRDQGGKYVDCARAFADAIGKAGARQYDRLDDGEKQLLYRFVTSALYQVMSHEISHLLRGHSALVEAKKMAVIDTEFEADVDAILAAHQAGRIATGLYYVVSPMDVFHKAAGYEGSDEYESWECRAKNVNDAAAIGNATLLFQSFVNRTEDVSPKEMNRRLRGAMASAAGDEDRFTDVGCGRLQADLLRALRTDMSTTVDSLIRNTSLFRATKPATEGVRRGVVFSSPEIIETMLTLIDQSEYLAPAIARTLSFYLQRATQEDSFEISDRLERDILQSVFNVSSSRTYGRTLAALAFRHFEGSVFEMTNKKRATELFETAVTYNPQMSEAHVNLSLISLTNKNCDTARDHALRSKNTATTNAALNDVNGLLELIDDLEAGGGGACR